MSDELALTVHKFTCTHAEADEESVVTEGRRGKGGETHETES